MKLHKPTLVTWAVFMLSLGLTHVIPVGLTFLFLLNCCVLVASLMLVISRVMWAHHIMWDREIQTNNTVHGWVIVEECEEA